MENIENINMENIENLSIDEIEKELLILQNKERKEQLISQYKDYTTDYKAKCYEIQTEIDKIIQENKNSIFKEVSEFNSWTAKYFDNIDFDNFKAKYEIHKQHKIILERMLKCDQEMFIDKGIEIKRYGMDYHIKLNTSKLYNNNYQSLKINNIEYNEIYIESPTMFDNDWRELIEIYNKNSQQQTYLYSICRDYELIVKFFTSYVKQANKNNNGIREKLFLNQKIFEGSVFPQPLMNFIVGYEIQSLDIAGMYNIAIGALPSLIRFH